MQRAALSGLLLGALLCAGASTAHATCLDPPGDVSGNGETSVVDVQCTILVVLWNLVSTGEIASDPLPACLMGELVDVDANCDGSVDVTDALLTVDYALSIALDPSLDQDGDDCPDACGQTDDPGGQVVSGSRRAFVTSQGYHGGLGGLAGADAKCQARADAAGLGGTWKAWLSDSTTDAAERLVHPDGALVRIDGVVIAENWDDLVSGWVDVALEVDEWGQQVPYVGAGSTPIAQCSWASGYFFHPWTATDNDGTWNGSTCLDWTSASAGESGRVGLGGYSLSQWTEWCDGFPCSWSQPLYCFEQG